LTPLPRRSFRFGALYAAELKLLARGPHLWWYGVAFGLVVAQAAAGGDTTRTLLAIAWLWPVLLLSGLGSREMRYNTHELVFSAPRPVVTQLPAMWLAALTVVAVLGSGAFLRFLLDGDTAHLLAWLGGALFIPSLALAVGVLTGSGKTFEVVYVVWIYIILQGVRPLDFVGVSRGSPWHVYVLLTPVLTALAFSVRHWRLASGRVPA
ncbi:MAG TPA: hypothetical protein VFX49_01455, partial [Chloroflexota bacterium]|nr:hypothetical protein [Chloroflexota bacterium]